jgi:hypothetical protein
MLTHATNTANNHITVLIEKPLTKTPPTSILPKSAWPKTRSEMDSILGLGLCWGGSSNATPKRLY